MCYKPTFLRDSEKVAIQLVGKSEENVTSISNKQRFLRVSE